MKDSRKASKKREDLAESRKTYPKCVCDLHTFGAILWFKKQCWAAFGSSHTTRAGGPVG